MAENIEAVQVGLGPIGRRITKHLVTEREGIDFIGAIDVNPDLVGSDLGKVAGLNESIGIKVFDDSERVFEKEPKIAIYSTVSSAKRALQQMKPAVKKGIDIISTSEELAYPDYSEEKVAQEYDRLAKEYNSTILGTGINPGFLMDIRPKILTTGCTDVERVMVTRRMNATPRRKPFQKKIGVSLSKEEFFEAIESQEITGHVGLEESISLIAKSLGWKLEEIKVEKVTPIIAEDQVSSQYFEVEEGEVKGVSQQAYGIANQKEIIKLSFKAFLDADPSYDLVEVDGTPEINSKISPCWHGDYGTVAMVANLIPTVINASPGLLTMNDLVPISYKSDSMSNFIK